MAKRLPWWLAIALISTLGATCGASQQTANRPAEPTALPASDLPNLIAKLPEYARFGFSGAAFFGDQLFVTSNLGLMTVRDFKIDRLYQWSGRDSVIEGPWLDPVRNSLWVQKASDGTFLRYDGKQWFHVPMPRPPLGYYSRGDMLSGFNGIASKTAFWMVGGGGASRAEANGEWITEPLPPLSLGSRVVGAVPVGERLIYIVNDRGGFSSLFPVPYSAYDSARRWSPIDLGEMLFAGVAAAGESVYILKKDGTILELTAEAVTNVTAPGPCEVIEPSSSGELLAVVTGQGVFSYSKSKKQWAKKADYPYDASEGEHSARLTEANGHLAYITGSVPHIVGDSMDNKWRYTGTDALWVLEGAKLRRVVIQ